MDSPHSGSHNGIVELLRIETNLFDLYIQGKPFHPTVETLQLHRTNQKEWVEAALEVHPKSHLIDTSPTVLVYSPEQGKLINALTEKVVPCFYETQTYELVIHNKKPDKHQFGFHHDDLGLRHAIKSHKNVILSGILNFRNEVGYTDLQVTIDGGPGLSIRLEIFPSKMDYKRDYQAILEDVNEQIYNLSFDFMRKTYNLTGLRETQNQSLSEFFTILKHVFEQLVMAVERIQDAPHHKLDQESRILDAAKVKRAGRANIKFLNRNPHLLVQDEQYGFIHTQGQSYRPEKLIESKRKMDYNTGENRFVKWMLERINRKLKQLVSYLHTSERKTDPMLLDAIAQMQNHIRRLLQFDFLREAGSMQHMSVTLVLQMAPGYRDAYRIYLMLMKGLVIQSDLFHLSMKDLALLYEYWCFLKIHHLLSKKYKLISQDVIKVNQVGLFVTLDKKQAAKMIYENPLNGETFTLHYNNLPIEDKGFPTLSQKPDNVLTITKIDAQQQPRVYKYVFDAKYRLNPAYEGTPYHNVYKMPGPEEDDINTMHRYRDAIVYQEHTDRTYERTMFGAYVLFPYGDEEQFKSHKFYKSIELLNIGAFPFLPNATGLMEKFLDELILDSPEKAYERSTRPLGTDNYYQDKLSGKNVLIISVRGNKEFIQIRERKSLEMPLELFKELKLLTQLEHIALYQPKGYFTLREQGVHWAGKIDNWQVVRKQVEGQNPGEIEESLYVSIKVTSWNRLINPILPGNHHIQTCFLTTKYLLDRAREIGELKLETEEQLASWREQRRQGKVQVVLDHEYVELASGVIRMDNVGYN